MKNILTLVFVVIVSISFAQYGLGIIVDPDGYVNVRSSPNIENNVISTIPSDTPVFCYDKIGNWIPIELNEDHKIVTGYIYHDRILLLDSLEKIKPIRVQDHEVEFQIFNTNITIKEQKLGSKELNLLDCEGDYEYCYNGKDGKPIWGTDGGCPRRSYQSISINSKMYSSVSPEISHYFQPNLTYTNCFIHDSTIYLSALNSDGAGGYIVIWTIKNDQIIDHRAFYGF